jgi:hypothetical protein
MAVTMVKNFWNGTEYKSISKIVFTSPNFTSPYQAGTRSHMQPGGQYMGTWYEAVDFMYRQKPDQDYASLPDQMESFFGKVTTASGAFNFASDTSITVYHDYGEDFDLVGGGAYPNILYKDKDNYASISSVTVISGSDSTRVDIVLTDVVGDAVLNDTYTTSGTVSNVFSDIASPVGEISVSTGTYIVNLTANDVFNTAMSGEVSTTLSGIVYSGANETVSGTLNGNFGGIVEGFINNGRGIPVSSAVYSDEFSVLVTGHDYGSTISGSLDVTISEPMPEVGNTMDVSVSGTVTAYSSDSRHVTLSGVVSGDLSGLVSYDVDYPNVSGTVSGTVTGILEGVYDGEIVSSNVSGTMYVPLSGLEYVTFNSNNSCSVFGTVVSVVSGTVDVPVVGSFIKAPDTLYYQYSNESINGSSTIPRPRRHHGENSILFAVTFGEAYDCRLTAWDDDTHATTLNKILDEEHYRVDAVAYRSNLADSAHSPIFKKTNNLVFPPAMDIVLKGNENYYGDFDLIFSIQTDEYGEYLAFLPRLVDIDDSFVAGSYDFVTTLHYQYT